jgi:hypothetical protein
MPRFAFSASGFVAVEAFGLARLRKAVLGVQQCVRSRQAVPGALAALGGGRLGRPLRCGARAKGARIARFTRFARYAQTVSASQFLKRVSARAALGPPLKAGPVARPLARHKQSTGLFVSGLAAASYGDRTGHRLPLDHRSLWSLVAHHGQCSKGAWGWPSAAVIRRRAAQEARPRAYPRASTSDSRMLFERSERSERSELSAGRAFEQASPDTNSPVDCSCLASGPAARLGAACKAREVGAQRRPPNVGRRRPPPCAFAAWAVTNKEATTQPGAHR